MGRSKFTEQQIVYALQQHEAGFPSLSGVANMA